MKWDERLSIRGRLFLLVLALALPFSIYVALSTWQQASEEREHAGQQMLGIARLTAARLDDHVGDIRQLLAVLAEVVGTQIDATHSNETLLRNLASKLPDQIQSLSVWTDAGENVGVFDTGKAEHLLAVRGHKFFRDALAGENLVVEAPLWGISGGEPIGVFALAIRRGGTAVGVVTASVPLSTLHALLSPAGNLPPGAVVTVMDASGVVISRSIDWEQWIGRSLKAAAAAGANPHDAVRDGPSADGVERIGGLTTASHVPWMVYVGLPTEAALVPVQKRLRETLSVGGAMLVLGLLVAAWIGKRISAPLGRLAEDAASLERGELAHRSEVRQGGELGQLALTINRMSAALEERAGSLQSSQDQLRLIADNLPVLISYLDRDLRFRFANSVYKTWLGVHTNDMIGKSLEEFYGAESFSKFRHHIELAVSGKRVVYERDLATLSGTRRIEVTLVPHATDDGKVNGLFVLMQDVTVNREAVAARERSEERLTLALEGSGAALFDWDIACDLIYHSAQATAMRGDPPQEETISPARLREWVHPDDREQVMANFRSTLVGEVDHYESEFRIKTRSDSWVWIRGRGRVVERNADGRALRLAGTYSDITPRKIAEDRLRHLAEFDALTGLPNRVLFNDRLHQAMARSVRTGKRTALLFLDIDHFKSVNDTFGHEAGDKLLTDFARTLQENVRATDTVARLAGDEFTVILEGLRTIADAGTIAQTLVDKTRRTLRLGSQIIGISTSIGVAFVESKEVDATAVLRRADLALYAAKRGGRDRYAMQIDSQQHAEVSSESEALNSLVAQPAAKAFIH